MHKRSITAALVTAPALVAAVLAAPSASASTPSPAAVPNTAPSWLSSAQHLGTASSKAAVSAKVYLAPRGGSAALKSAALAVSTKGSASYRKFLTPAQYDARYAPTKATVSSVEKYLTSSGLKVTGVEAHNRYISVSGTVGEAQNAFHTTIGRYRHSGQTVQAPSSTVKVAASVRSSILTVGGLDTTVTKMTTAQDPPPAGFRNARPCSIYYGQVAAKKQADFQTKLPKFKGNVLPYAPCGYTGPQFRSAYEGNTTLDGSGVTVGIIDAYAAPTIAADANTYAENHGDGSYGKNQLTQTNSATFTDEDACGGANGWWGEETLDVEAVHAMAPGAKIHFYGAKSCFDNDLATAAAKAVDQGKVSIISNSYGDVEEAESADGVIAWEQVFLQGALEGISFTFSSGDNGDEVAHTALKQADYPTSDPYVTSVGGTSTDIDGNGALAGQAGWGTDKYTLSADGTSWTSAGYLYGAGGGSSALFNKPSYQSGVVVGGARSVPDVAMDADPTTGMLVGETQTFSDGVYYDEYRIGGTSLASPLFAGMTALAFQKAGGGIGLLNPTVYANATSGVFTDVKGAPFEAGNVRPDYVNSENADDGILYSVRTFGQDSSLTVKTGYDQVTGLGSPNKKWLSAIPTA